MKGTRNSILSLFLLLAITSKPFAQSGSPLESNFQNPPPAAKAQTWWHWLNGNVTKAGITADLEAMKHAGIQEAHIFNANLGHPEGPITYLSPEWLALFKFAATEAQRLELTLGFHNGAGWSSSGGPWITPEYSMQLVVFSETTHEGNNLFKGHLPQPETRLDYYQDIAVLAFPKPTGSDRIDDLDIKTLSGKIRNHLEPDLTSISSSSSIQQSDIIDLTSLVGADGYLEWNAPEGTWIILRLGHTPTGKMNKPAITGGRGLECDKMSREAVDVYWEGGILPIIEELDTMIGTVVTNCLIDSYEVGCTNWTAGFQAAFKRLRSYDCLRYLPTLAGYYVESGEISERFLWDFRRTIGDLIAENYYGYFGERCHQYGMNFSIEPYWGPFDNMQVGSKGDIVMSEFWSGSTVFFDSPKFVASIAKLNGSPIVAAEAFTDKGGWLHHPATLKSIGDRAWAQGVNRFIFHTYVHQPWNTGPGLTLGPFGTDFNRLNTWWNQVKAFTEYMGRSQFLLQQGSFVADVLIFTGESSPNNALIIPEIKALGYDYDLIGVNLINSLTVRDGLISTPQGDTYRALLLPNTSWVRPETLQKIGALAKQGAKIIGPKPVQSPSLQNYPSCDQQVAQWANQLWDTHVIEDGSIIDYLQYGDLPPDFQIEQGEKEGISFIHRKTPEIDIYFIANSRKESRQEQFSFRVSGKQPERWDPQTGKITNLLVWRDHSNGTTSVPVTLDSEGSVFIVFRKPVSDSDHIIASTFDLQNPEEAAPADVNILQAEYGTFLPDGVIDLTKVVENRVEDNRLHLFVHKEICSCDPAQGYIKEIRIEYMVDGQSYVISGGEREYVTIDAAGRGELKILRAVYGKFERGTPGVPPTEPVYDVTEKIRFMLSSGAIEIPVNDGLVDTLFDQGNPKTLRIMYSHQGETHEQRISTGNTFTLPNNSPKPEFSIEEGEGKWVTPYNGTLTYSTASGSTETVHVTSVPRPIVLTGPWELTFPPDLGAPAHATVDSLVSWTSNTDEGIKYFSGTATYTKEFFLPKHLLQPENSLELDLGRVSVIAEVTLNGQHVGTLWKSPFRVNIDDFVQKGENTLEVHITNLWPNRLIGDEQESPDFERKGRGIEKWPDWLLNQSERPENRFTFSTYQHWEKDAELQPSGLLGPVIIRTYRVEPLQK